MCVRRIWHTPREVDESVLSGKAAAYGDYIPRHCPEPNCPRTKSNGKVFDTRPLLRVYLSSVHNATIDDWTQLPYSDLSEAYDGMEPSEDKEADSDEAEWFHGVPRSSRSDVACGWTCCWE